MGGKGSGGHNRLSDEEKISRGTMRPGRSEADYDKAAGDKIVTGPWLSKIPEPEYPLGEVGRQKYDDVTKELFEQNKLTKVTVTMASAFALLHQKIHRLASAGKEPSANDFSKFQALMRDLNIAQNATVTVSPEGRNRFVGSGFSTPESAPVRIRTTASSGS